MKIITKPLDGIYFEDKKILLGEERRSVEETVTNISSKQKIVHERGLSIYLFNTNLRVDFDNNDCVEFIEFLGGFHSEVQALIYGVDAFKTNADELFELLKKHNEGEIGDNENGYSYAFKNIGVGIWRGSTPENLAEFIKEIRNEEGIDEAIVEENIKEEMLKSNYWQTLGIGIKNYYM